MTRSSSLAMRRLSIEIKSRKYVKGYGFLSFARTYEKKLLDTGLNGSKNVVHKVGEFLGSKIADAVSQLNNEIIVKPDENPINVKEITIPIETRNEILNKVRK